MEQIRTADLLVIEILRRKSVVGTRAVEEHPVDSLRCDHDGIRSVLSLRLDHGIRRHVLADLLLDDCSEGVLPYFSHKDDISPKNLKADPRVGNAAATIFFAFSLLI